MKNILILLLIISAFAACKKDDKVAAGGPPVINKVYTPTDRNTGLNTGELNQWLIISGSNLATTQNVQFNDVTVGQEDIFANDTSVTVRVPRQIPGNVNNMITVTTPGGSATYNFEVIIPQLKISGMANEYVKAGDTLEIIGDYFDLYELDTTLTTVSFTGGSTVNVVASGPTSLKVIVPQDAQPGPLEIKGPAPLNQQATTSAWYMDNRNFLFDIATFGGWNGSAFITPGPDPAPINGPYFKINKSWAGGWAWDPFCSNNCNIPQELVADASKYKDYALKFEMYTPASGPALPLKLNIVFNTGGFKDYFYDPTSSNNFPYSTKGQWRTFTVPLKDWGNLDGYTFANPMIMEFMLKDANPSESNFSICNFRLVPL